MVNSINSKVCLVAERCIPLLGATCMFGFSDLQVHPQPLPEQIAFLINSNVFDEFFYFCHEVNHEMFTNFEKLRWKEKVK